MGGMRCQPNVADGSIIRLMGEICTTEGDPVSEDTSESQTSGSEGQPDDQCESSE